MTNRLGEEIVSRSAHNDVDKLKKNLITKNHKSQIVVKSITKRRGERFFILGIYALIHLM